MHQSASNQIIDYLTSFEAFVPWMYLDSLGLVTTGIGNLLDPYSTYGKKVSFYWRSDNGRATDAEVKAEFDLVKSKAVPGGRAPQAGFQSYKAFESITKLRASKDDVYAAVRTALKALEAAAVQYFGRDFDTLPADVQVVFVQMSNAGGLVSRKGQLAPLLKKRDFVAARDYAYLSNAKQGRNGYKKYNSAFRILMMNGWILDQCSKKNRWPTGRRRTPARSTDSNGDCSFPGGTRATTRASRSTRATLSPRATSNTG